MDMNRRGFFRPGSGLVAAVEADFGAETVASRAAPETLDTDPLRRSDAKAWERGHLAEALFPASLYPPISGPGPKGGHLDQDFDVSADPAVGFQRESAFSVQRAPGSPEASKHPSSAQLRSDAHSTAMSDALPISGPDPLFEAFLKDAPPNVQRSARMRYYGQFYRGLYGRPDRPPSSTSKPREMQPLHSDEENAAAREYVARFNAKNPGRQRSLHVQRASLLSVPPTANSVGVLLKRSFHGSTNSNF
jgi:hypothetical protein